MKQFGFIGFFLLSLVSFAQEPEWFELGTTWVYNWNGVADPDQQDFTHTYCVTEIIEFLGQPCSKIEPSISGFGCLPYVPPFYMYESGDTVFYATDGMDVFAVGLILTEGAEWTYTAEIGGSEENMSASVLNFSMINVEGQELREMEVTYTHLSGDEGLVEIFPATRTIWEFIGDPLMFIIPFGEVGFCDVESNIELRCFSSLSLNYENPAFDSCTLSAEETKKERQVLFPNPTSNSVFWTSSIDQISVFDVAGKLLLQKQTNGEQFLSVEQLPPGFYTVLISKSGVVFSQKLIID